MDKESFLKLIGDNILNHEYHITIVNSKLAPRFAYSIGLYQAYEFELVIAGAIFYLKDDLFKIFKSIIDALKENNEIDDKKVTIGSLGTFLISKVDSSWSELMLLGVFDFYKISNLQVFQIIPEAVPTLDIPDMSKKFVAIDQPVWQWLTEKWGYPVPENSTVTTNINALLGEPVTELTRWENDEWEMFAGAGPDIDKEDLRIVSLATMLGIDNSLSPALDLELEGGLWRETKGSDWTIWE